LWFSRVQRRLGPFNRGRFGDLANPLAAARQQDAKQSVVGRILPAS
jgi:hypothetical protein